MIRRTTFLAALMLLPLTAAVPASPALAQDAIMLETIGAVRMAPPEEVRHMNDEAARQQRETAQRAAPQRSSAVAD